MTAKVRGHNSDKSTESPSITGANQSCDDHTTSCDSDFVPSARIRAKQSCDNNITLHDSKIVSLARVAILFSGGIDSAVIAALADR